jgi:hypothetical protein
MLFSYAVRIDAGPLHRGEVEAKDAAQAIRFAKAYHAAPGALVAGSRVFEPPLRQGTRPAPPQAPRARLNYILAVDAPTYRARRG